MAQGWQAGLYLTGLAVACLALLSAIDRLASVLLTLHMVQHLLLMMVAAPLLLFANPFPAFLWGLPSRIRHGVGRLLRPGAGVRRAFWIVTWMPVAGAIFAVNLWVWHHPAAYQAALRHGYIHDLEHLAFFGTALLFWWPILNPVPQVHGRIHPGFPTLHLLYLAAATGQHILLGALLALPERVFYPFYAATPRLWGLSPLNDQALAGGIMWVAAHMYLLPVLWVVARIFAEEERAVRAREAAEVLQHSLAQHTPPQGQVLGGARKT